MSFDDVSHYVCSYYFSSVSIAEWPPFWEIAANSFNHMFSFVFGLICNISYFPFWNLGLDFGF